MFDQLIECLDDPSIKAGHSTRYSIAGLIEGWKFFPDEDEETSITRQCPWIDVFKYIHKEFIPILQVESEELHTDADYNLTALNIYWALENNMERDQDIIESR